MEIKYINYGIGNRVGDTIYLNSALKQSPELHRAILSHEKKHGGGFSWLDLKLDLRMGEIKGLRGEYYRFLLKNPRAWLNFFPIMKLNGVWTYDIGILFVWLISIFVLALIWFSL